MIVLHKKRIIFFVYHIFFIIFALSYLKASNNQGTLQTMALPVSNKVVVLDAGHGLPDKRGNTVKMAQLRVKST